MRRKSTKILNTGCFAAAMFVLFSVLAIPVLSEQQRIEPAGEFTEPLTGMVFKVVKGGCFRMGCGPWFWSGNCESDEKPVRRICLDTFLIGRYEVTQHQWQTMMGANPAHARDCGSDCPIEMVSWEEVQEFITRLNARHKGRYRFRLPTEAEWEYACRGGGKPEIFCGGDKNRSLAWYRVTSRGRPHPVGTKQPNGLGVHDMSGNVWEWCADYYGIYTKTNTTNPKGPSKGSSRVIRGGGWGDHYSRFCRSAYRDKHPPYLRSKFIGFRLVANSPTWKQPE